MCLAIPGKIISLNSPLTTSLIDRHRHKAFFQESGKDGELLTRLGQVEFDGIIKEVNLSCVPEANVGDYVIVHVGFAISKIDASAAKKTRHYLKQM